MTYGPSVKKILAKTYDLKMVSHVLCMIDVDMSNMFIHLKCTSLFCSLHGCHFISCSKCFFLIKTTSHDFLNKWIFHIPIEWKNTRN